MRNKKILITGGAGFIGSNLALRLVELGAKVSVLDSMVPTCGGNRFNLDPVKTQITLHTNDLGDEATLERVVPGLDYIFNLAGNVSHQDSMSHPLVDLDLNATVHLKLLEVCRKLNPGVRVVYASTRQLYGKPVYLPVDEKHPIEPIDVNGIHKFAGEQYHRLYAKVHGLKATSLRLTNTYGPRQLIKHARQGFIGWFVNRVVTGNKIQLFGTGQQLRDFNYIDDVVEAMLAAIDNEKCFGEIFNLSGDRANLETIAKTLVRLHGSGSCEITPFPPELKKIELGDYYGTSEKFKAATGWSPKTGVEDGLRRTLEYYSKNKNHYLDG